MHACTLLSRFTPFAYITCVHASRTSHLVEGPQVVQLHHLRVNPSGEDETLWIEGAHRLPLQVHQALGGTHSATSDPTPYVIEPQHRP